MPGGAAAWAAVLPGLLLRASLAHAEHYDEVSRLYDTAKERLFYFDCLRRMVPCLKVRADHGASHMCGSHCRTSHRGACARLPGRWACTLSVASPICSMPRSATWLHRIPCMEDLAPSGTLHRHQGLPASK